MASAQGPVFRPVTQVERVRGTQSLVQILAQCWRSPGLIARELAWRWLFGIPALLLLSLHARHLFAILLAAHTGLEDFSLQQPVAATQIIRASYLAIVPAVLRTATWLTPLLMLGWAVASGFGRAVILRRLAPEGGFRPVALCLLQLLRMIALVVTVWAWFAMVRWAARGTITSLSPNLQSNTVGFAAWLICLSLGSFTVWALWSWTLSIAGVLLVADRRSLLSSLAASVRQGALTTQLVEINLVLGIVKLALIVLAMVFSAVPLPFEAQMAGMPLYIWWGFVGVLYLVASDFFQVGRLVAFLDFWRRGQRIHL